MDQEMEGFTEQGKVMNEAARAIIKWAEKYLSSVYDDDAGTVYFAGRDQFIREYQLFFISNYAFMMQLGNDLSQIGRIEKILNHQMPENEDKLMKFRFMGGTPVDVFLSAESLDDVDIADIYGLTAFRSMNIRRNDRKSWTKKDIYIGIRAGRKTKGGETQQAQKNGGLKYGAQFEEKKAKKYGPKPKSDTRQK